MALIVLLFHLSDIWPELPTERLLQNESHSVWRATGMWWHKKKQKKKEKVELPLMRPIWCISFLHMATLVCADSCSQQITQNVLKPMIPIIVWLQHRRHPDQQRDVENWNITRINPPPQKKEKKGCGVSLNVDKHSGRRAHENWCWKKLLAFVSPSPRSWGKNANFKPVNGGTVILTWPASCARALRWAARGVTSAPLPWLGWKITWFAVLLKSVTPNAKPLWAAGYL